MITTFLWELSFDILLGSIPDVLRLVLRLLWDVLRRLVSQVLRSGHGSRLRIHARVGAVLLVPRGQVGGVGGITRTAGMSRLRGITSGVLHVAARKGFLFAVLVLGLILEVIAGQIRHLVPRVIVGRLVDLGQLVLGRVDTRGGALSRVASDIAEQDGRIAHWQPR